MGCVLVDGIRRGMFSFVSAQLNIIKASIAKLHRNEDEVVMGGGN